MTTNETVAAGRWIVSPRYDLAFFFGGAAASLAALGLYFAGVPIPPGSRRGRSSP